MKRTLLLMTIGTIAVLLIILPILSPSMFAATVVESLNTRSSAMKLCGPLHEACLIARPVLQKQSWEYAEQVQHDLDTINAEYHNRANAATLRFDAELPASVSGPLEQARAAIPGIVHELTDGAFIKNLFDANFKESALEERIKETVEKNLFPHLSLAYQGGLNCRETHRQRMVEGRNQYLSELAVIAPDPPKSSTEAEPLLELAKSLRTKEIISRQASNFNRTVIPNLVISSFLWKATLRDICSIGRLARSAALSLVKRLARRGAVAGILPWIDGPLPVGDVIGGLFFAYEVYAVTRDVKNLKKKIPRDMERNLMESVDRYEQVLIATMTDQTHQEASVWRATQARINRELQNNLEKE